MNVILGVFCVNWRQINFLIRIVVKFGPRDDFLDNFLAYKARCFLHFWYFCSLKRSMNITHPNAQESSFNRTSESTLKAKSIRLLNSCEFWDTVRSSANTKLYGMWIVHTDVLEPFFENLVHVYTTKYTFLERFYHVQKVLRNE